MQVAGVRLLIDMEGFSLGHVVYFTPRTAAIALEFAQKCLPGRFKGIHIINQPNIVKMVYAVFKPFLQVFKIPSLFFVFYYYFKNFLDS